MFGLDNLFAQTSAQKFYISRDRIAEILRVSPDALDAFEKAYSKAALQTEPESIFEVNSRQAAAKNERLGDDSPEELKALTERIVKELIWQTLTYTYDGKTGKIEKSLSNAPEKNAPVTNQDLLRIPASLRPQLSGELMLCSCATTTRCRTGRRRRTVGMRITAFGRDWTSLTLMRWPTASSGRIATPSDIGSRSL